MKNTFVRQIYITIPSKTPSSIYTCLRRDHFLAFITLTGYSNWPYTPPSSEVHTKAPTKTQAIILGLGSMFNHSNINQNVVWIRDLEKSTVTYKTLRDIKQGEELCISYGDRLTFVDTEMEEWKRVEMERRDEVGKGKSTEDTLWDALPGGDFDELDANPGRPRLRDAIEP